MRAVFLPGNSTAVVADRPIPTPGPGQVLVKVGASGICGSDLNLIYRGYRSHWPGQRGARQGVVAGHEVAGTVVSVGAGHSHLQSGARVLLYHVVGCGHCLPCRKGYFICCDDDSRESYGFQRDGGQAEYVLAEESSCLALPPALSYIDGALVGCCFTAAYEAIRRLAVGGADTTLVVGLGPLGLAAGMIARGMGAHRVVGVERNGQRAVWAEALGVFDAVYDVSGDDGGQFPDATEGEEFSTSIECSGSVMGRRLAIDAISSWGRIGLVGEGGALETDVSSALLRKQATIHGSLMASVATMEELTRQLVAWRMRPERIVSDVFSLEEADLAYKTAAAQAGGKVCIIPPEAASLTRG